MVKIQCLGLLNSYLKFKKIKFEVSLGYSTKNSVGKMSSPLSLSLLTEQVPVCGPGMIPFLSFRRLTF